MRIAVLSDVHSNHIALEKVAADAKNNRGVNGFWFLGDAIGYGWQPVETLGLLNELIPVENWLIGNHDALYADILHPAGFRPEAQIMMNHNRSLIEAQAKSSDSFSKFMAKRFIKDAQPPKQKYIDGAVYFLTHNAFDWSEYEYYFFDAMPEYHRERCSQLFDDLRARPRASSWQFWRKMGMEQRILFLGHSHLPVVSFLDPENNEIKSLKIRRGSVDFKQTCKNSPLIVINPGSVGFPKDHWPYPSYVVLDTKKKEVEFCRVMDYDYMDFKQGYSHVKKGIMEYICDGLWKKVVSHNHHNGEKNVKYDVEKFTGQDIVGRIEQELHTPHHPLKNDLRPDYRDFYHGDLDFDFS